MKRNNMLYICLSLVLLSILAVGLGFVGYTDKYSPGQAHMKTRSPYLDFSRIGNYILSYEDACENPKDSIDANLCIQRESSKVFQKQVTWARLTFLLSVIGTGALAATLIYTIKTVRIATKTSRTALKQMKIARGDFIASHRPWLDLKVVSVGLKCTETSISFDIKIVSENFGNVPGTDLFLTFRPVPEGIGSNDVAIENVWSFITSNLKIVTNDTIFPGRKADLLLSGMIPKQLMADGWKAEFERVVGVRSVELLQRLTPTIVLPVLLLYYAPGAIGPFFTRQVIEMKWRGGSGINFEHDIPADQIQLRERPGYSRAE